MDEKKYNVIFSGKFVKTKDKNEIEKGLSKIFKRDIETIRNAFTVESRVIKKNINYKNALKISKVLNEVGALCTVEESSKPEKPKSLSPKRDKHKTEKASKIKVVSPQLGREDISLTPIPTRRITGWEGGININRAEREKIDYRSITLVSVFQDKTYKILFFVNDSKRPFISDCDAIAFPEFPDVKRESILPSLRNFLIHVLRKNRNIIVDKGTYEFLRGKPPVVFKKDVLFMTTALESFLPLHRPDMMKHGVPGAKLMQQKQVRVDGKNREDELSSCQKCGMERESNQKACHRCGLVFSNWGRENGEYWKEVSDAGSGGIARDVYMLGKEGLVIEAPPLLEDYEEKLDINTAYRQVDEWSADLLKIFSLMLILGFLLPMIKYSEIYKSTIIIWPWQLMGFVFGEDVRAAIKELSGGRSMVVWNLMPLFAGTAVLILKRYLSLIHRSIVMLIIGTFTFAMLVTIFIVESKILDVIFLPGSFSGGIMYIIFMLSAGMVAAANHLRKRFKSDGILRVISGVGGFFLFVVSLMLLITSIGSWKALPMIILYVALLFYGALGIYSASQNIPDVSLLSLMSKTSRGVIFWAFLAALLAQTFFPDPILSQSISGGGLIHSFTSITKTAFIYLGSAFMAITGATALIAIGLYKRAE
ncbi:hypothetical protein ACFL2O_05095 [Thermodesulfobacteriota bacterium]